MKYLIIGILASLALAGCATRPHVYKIPDPTRIQTSTQKVSTAVDQAHGLARKAQGAVQNAKDLTAQVRSEVSEIKEVPPELVLKINTLEDMLVATLNIQSMLELRLSEADIAKVQAKKDLYEYLDKTTKLANDASGERDKRIADEKKLSWYRWHWWGSWIALGLGVLACAAFAILKAMGKLAFL